MAEGDDTDCAEVTGSGCAWFVKPPDKRCDTEALPETGETGETGEVHGGGGGGACAVVEPGPGVLLAVLCALAILLRRRGGLAAALAVLVPALAHAADLGVDAQTLQPLDGGPFPALLEPDLGRRWDLQAAASVDLTHAPVVYRDDQGSEVLLESVVTQELGVSLRIADAVRAGVAFPSHHAVIYRDHRYDALPGDLTLWCTVPLRELPKRLRLASTVRLTVPTGSPEAYLGDPQGSVRGAVAAAGRLGSFEGLVNLGVRLALPAELPGLQWDNRLEWGAGVSHALFGPTWVTAETFGSVGLPSNGSAGDTPVEGLLSVGGAVWRGVGVTGGVGAGFTPGLGSPAWRVVGMIDARRRAAHDLDEDGIIDRKDACPSVPEDHDGLQDADGCPEDDADRDGVHDEIDECPLEPETKNGWADTDGCPDAVSTVVVSARSADPAVPLERAHLEIEGDAVDVLGDDAVELVRPPGELVVKGTADGFEPATVTFHVAPGSGVELPVVLEPIRYGDVTVRLEDTGGHALVGSVRGGVGPAIVPVEGVTLRASAGPAQLRVASPGYRTRVVDVTVPRDAAVVARVTLEPSGLRQDGSRIETTQEIRFPLDSAQPTPESEEPLDEIAALLLTDPSIVLLRVEGHADAQGSSAYNLDLSRRRAAAVRDRLVALGVAPDRLEAIGSGEAEQRAGARRAVSFTVLVWADDGPAPALPAPAPALPGPSPAAPTGPSR